MRDFPTGQVAKTPHSQGRGPAPIPGQGTRFHMLQLRSGELATSIHQSVSKSINIKKKKGPLGCSDDQPGLLPGPGVCVTDARCKPYCDAQASYQK